MNWGRVGDVPAVWSDAAPPGSCVAGLGFRVGRTDEPLARSGLTHLVEHLALSGLGDQLYEYDAWTGGTTTWFAFSGEPGELGGFLAAVEANLANLPLDRLATEVNVVRAEAARQPMSVLGRSLLYRFGTTGWGTIDLTQYGLNGVTPEQVRDWAAQWFVAGNAVLWSTVEPPAGALSSALPAGPRRPERDAIPLPTRSWPAWVGHREALTAATYLTPRTDEAAAAMAILQARLRSVLRDRDGACYEVALHVEALDAFTGHVAITADGPPGAVLDALDRVTDDVATAGPTAAEIDRQLALARRRLNDPTAVPGFLTALANARLCGWDLPEPDEALLRLEGLAPVDFAALVTKAAETALYLVPLGTPVPASMARPIPRIDAEAVVGRALHPTRRRHADEALVVGPAGISEVSGAGCTTVRADQATAALSWANGARMLIGPDGSSVRVDPHDWKDSAKAVALLDRALPPAVVVPMGLDPGWS